MAIGNPVDNGSHPIVVYDQYWFPSLSFGKNFMTHSTWKNALRRCAINWLWSGPFLLHYVSSTDSVQKAKRHTFNPIIGIHGFNGLQEISHMTNMDSCFTHRVGLFNNLDQASFLEALNGFKLGKVIKCGSIQLEREASSMASVLPVHEELVDFLDQLHTWHLDVKGLNSRSSNFYCKTKVLKTNFN